MRKIVILAVSTPFLIAILFIINSCQNTLKVILYLIGDSVFYLVQYWFDLIEGFISLISLRLKAFLPGGQFFLLMGFIFGQQENITDTFYQNLKITGLLHLVVASGSNVSMMLGLAQMSLSRFRSNRIGYYLVTLLIIWTYCQLLDYSPPILRATTMATFMIFCQLFSRQYQPIWFLLLSFTLLVFIDFSLLTNLSFQLSILSSLGIMVGLKSLQTVEGALLNLLDKGFSNSTQPSLNWWLAILSDSFFTTIAAQMFSLPIILVTFHQFSWISIVANTFLLGLTPLINLTALLLIVSLVFKPFLQLPLVTSFFIFFTVTQVFIKAIDIFSSLSVGLDEIFFTRFHFLIWWASLMMFFVGKYVFWRRARGWQTRYE